MERRAGGRGYAAGMTDDSLKDRLVQSLEAARDEEAVLLALCDDSPPLQTRSLDREGQHRAPQRLARARCPRA